MKKLFRILLMTFVVFSYSIQAIISQSAVTKKPVRYKTWVTMMDNSSTISGSLRIIEDSSIWVYDYNKKKTISINVDKIDIIRLRKKNRVGNGIFLGAATGFLIGGIIGLASGDGPSGQGYNSASNKGIFYGTLFAIPGAIIGGISVSAKFEIPIRGSRLNYSIEKRNLEKYRFK